MLVTFRHLRVTLLKHGYISHFAILFEHIVHDCTHACILIFPCTFAHFYLNLEHTSVSIVTRTHNNWYLIAHTKNVTFYLI